MSIQNGQLLLLLPLLPYCEHSRACKLAKQTRPGNDALLNKAPPHQENTQVTLTLSLPRLPYLKTICSRLTLTHQGNPNLICKQVTLTLSSPR